VHRPDVRPGRCARARLLRYPRRRRGRRRGTPAGAIRKAGQRYVARARGSNREDGAPRAGADPGTHPGPLTLSRAPPRPTSIDARCVPQRPVPTPWTGSPGPVDKYAPEGHSDRLRGRELP
jgi:hypothetical protein